MKAPVKGKKVKFERNASTKSDKAVVAFYQPEDIEKNEREICIIEYSDGWAPNQIRQQKFGLSPKKKYLFVNVEELTAN